MPALARPLSLFAAPQISLLTLLIAALLAGASPADAAESAPQVAAATQPAKGAPPIKAGSQTFSTTYSTSNVSTIAISTAAQLTVFTGLQHMDFPFEASLSPGDWWMAVNRSTTFTSQGTNLSGIRVQHSLWGISQVNSAIGEFGVVNAASQQMMLGLGSVTTVGGAVATTINFADISSSASHLLPIVKFGRGLA